jgi:chromate transporter
MIFLQLFFEFFRAGLFAVGGGLATIPFLQDISLRTGWYSAGDLANMIAVSESTPGPMGVNMATYVGFEIAGVPGAVVATLGLICPSIIIILIISKFLQKFRQSRGVDAVFYGLRPASTALISAAGISVVAIALLNTSAWDGTASSLAQVFQWKCIILAAVLLVCTNIKKLKSLHPIVWILLAAVAGIVFQM